MAAKPEGQLRPVRWSRIVVMVMMGLLAGLCLKVVTGYWGVSPVNTGAWIVPAVMLLATAAVTAMAYITLKRRNRTVDPGVARLWLALSYAAIVGGALLLGIFVGYGIGSIPGRRSRFGHLRLVNSAIGAVLCLAVVTVGKLLERQLQIDPPPNEEDNSRP